MTEWDRFAILMLIVGIWLGLMIACGIVVLTS